jgi:integrase
MDGKKQGAIMKPCLVKRGNQYAVKYFNEEKRRWSHQSLGTTKRAVADRKFGEFIRDQQKKEFLGDLGVEPITLTKLVSEFLDYMESKRAPRYVQIVRQFTGKWTAFFGENTLSTAITPRMIEKYAIQRKKEICRIKKTRISNATVNRDLAALKHMLHKAEKWGYIEVSPGRHVELLSDDSTVRTDYFTQTQIEKLLSRAEEDRRACRNHFNDWPEFIQLDVNTGLRCQEMLFLEFTDIDWNSGVLHVRNKKHLGFSPKSRKERRLPLNEAALAALRAMLSKRHHQTDLVFHQADGSAWKSVLESFRSLLKRSGMKRHGIHALRHTFGAHLAQRGVSMAFIRDLLGHHSVTLTEKYYAHLAPNNLSEAVRQLEGALVRKSLPNSLPNCPEKKNLEGESVNGEPPLTDSFQSCYLPKVSLLAGVAKLAYAADSKSAGVHSPWGFKSLLRHFPSQVDEVPRRDSQESRVR